MTLTGDGGVRYSRELSEAVTDKKTITQYMTDSERTEVLKGKTITAEVYEGQADDSIAAEKENLNSNSEKLIKAALERIGEEFDVFTDYNIADVELSIRMSKGNLKESVSKEINPEQMAKLMPVFKTAVENAVGIERHANRYYYDNTTVMFENLLGGYIDNGYFVPVRFGLKHQRTGKASLYLIVDQQKIDMKKIKAEVTKTLTSQKGRREASHSAFMLSVAELIPFVNGKDLIRYLPDGMLNENQKRAKWEAIADTIKYTNDKNDKKYIEFVRSGKMDAAKNMIKMAAKASGYTTVFYHGSKKGGGFTEFRDWQYFTQNKEYAQRYTQRDNPGSLYTVYVKMENPFDTRNEDAREVFMEARQELGLGELQENGLPDWTDGYDLSDYIDENELDYDSIVLDEGGDMVDGKPVSRGLSYVIRKSNQIKSADVITYDDDGNIIPISERFNAKKEDIRYSREMDTQKALERQVELLKGKVEYWKEQTRTRKNIGKKADAAEVRKLGRRLLRMYSSDTALEEILPELQRLADQKDGYTEMSDISLTARYFKSEPLLCHSYPGFPS